MALLRSKPLPRQSLAALMVSAGLASTSLANPQMLPESGPWTSGDYVEAVFAVQNGVITLPRQGNPKTRAFFDRLVDRGNVDRLMAAPLRPEEKRRDILIMLSTTGEFRGRYGYAVALGDDVQNELVTLQVFRLYLVDRLVSLDIKDEDTGCMVETAGDPRCASTLATIVAGTLDTLAEPQSFTKDQLVALSTALGRHYPAIRAKLGAEEHLLATRRLEGLAAGESDPAVKSALATALAAVRGHD
ncbi:MAG: hypothetical protein AB7F09_06830 [Parvibaculaceae bacterium]